MIKNDSLISRHESGRVDLARFVLTLFDFFLVDGRYDLKTSCFIKRG